MLPWSVIARAGCSNSRARRMRSSIRFAPSRSEYSEWQCRCTKDIGSKNSAAVAALSKRRGECLLAVNYGSTTSWSVVAAIALALACGGPDPTAPLPLYTVNVVGGAQLAAPAGSELADRLQV